MKKGIAFSGSNSSTSINQQVIHAALTMPEAKEISYIDISHWNLPIFSIDIEKKDGFPEEMLHFHKVLRNADYFLIGTNEHNRNVSAFFKNILDWLSRIDMKTFENKKVYILSSSDGFLGGKAANEYLQVFFSRAKAKEIIETKFGLFYENFDTTHQKILNDTLASEIQEKLLQLQS